MPKQLTLEERKEYGMRVLDEIARVCSEMGIRFYLAYGTLLGAIRHKGYIPWDDDIDIWMFRSDYERFIREFNDRASSGFRLESYLSDGYPYLMVKVMSTETSVREKLLKRMDWLGIWVDIFPLDYVSEENTKAIDEMVRLEHRRWCALFRHSTIIGKAKLLGYNLLQHDTTYHDFLHDPADFTRRIHAMHASTVPTDLVKSPTSENSIRNLVYPSSCFDKALEVPFEDRTYPIPAGYDELLKRVYGDYMKLPPVAKRKLDKHLVDVRLR